MRAPACTLVVLRVTPTTGDRQATDQTRDDIRRALADEFPIETGARTGVHLVDRDGREQALHAGDQGDGQHHHMATADQLPEGSSGRPSASKTDPLRAMRSTSGRPSESRVPTSTATSGPGHRAQLRRDDYFQPISSPRSPRRRRVRHYRAARAAVREVRSDCAARCCARSPAEQHVDLLQGDGDADAGQHGVDHHGGDGERGPRDPAEPEQDLQHARGDDDETGGRANRIARWTRRRPRLDRRRGR